MDRHEVLDSKLYLSRIGEWPRVPGEANPARWLDNFDASEEQHALALLDAFIFFSLRQTKKLFTSAVHALSAEISSGAETYAGKRARWQRFCAEVIITHPTGEDPSTADSGYAYHRLARKELGFDEEQLIEPDAVPALISASQRPIMFVDDFVGSGNQFLETWRRQATVGGGHGSIQEAVEASGVPCYYVPAVCTQYAADRLASQAPGVVIRPAHIIPKEYGALAADSVVFPDHLRPTAEDFIRAASTRGGITNMMFGFHRLALAMGFEDSIPDATVPLIWFAGDRWIPLMRRS